jgi:hypothetical protein
MFLKTQIFKNLVNTKKIIVIIFNVAKITVKD